jgi:hypothetical protein
MKKPASRHSSQKEPKKSRFRPIIIIAILFSLYGIYQASQTSHEDTYAVVFAWILFATAWGIIAILRYENICGKC